MHRRLALMGIFAAFATLASPPASSQLRGLLKFGARSAAKGAARAGSGSTGPVLSRQQLRECLSEQKASETLGAELDQLERSLDAEGARIDRLAAQINDREPFVDERSQASVDDFNAMIDDHSSAVRRYNERLVGLDKSFGEYNRTVDSFNAKCADAEYYESDMQAILTGR